jgi:hypothetical protein
VRAQEQASSLGLRARDGVKICLDKIRREIHTLMKVGKLVSGAYGSLFRF